jgi:hypothetical protein
MSSLPESSEAPVWDTIPHEVRCPLCEYNLRGLSEPRCPECGHRFDWAVVIDPSRRLHPYLFEHHPERNLWSFARTLWGTLRPRRFWQSLPANQPLRPRRMIIYWLLAALVASTSVIGHWVRGIVTWWVESSPQWRAWSPYSPYAGRRTIPEPDFTWTHVREAAVFAWRQDALLGASVSAFVICFLWTWTTLLAFQVFRISMRRARVKPVHVLRCVVYSFDIGAWFGLLLGTVAVLTIWVHPPLGDFDYTSVIVAGLCVGWFVVVTYRLVRAYQLYMRFDHAISTVIASQAIAGLIILNGLVLWEEHLRRWFR